MRLSIIILIALNLGCTNKESAPTEAEPAPSAETKAPAETATPTEAGGAASPSDQAELPAELQGPTPPVGESPSLKVLEPGGNPSQQLRWDVKPGFEQTLSMKVHSSAEALIGGTLPVKGPQRSAIHTIKLKAEKVAPGGALQVAFTIDELEVQYETGIRPEQHKRRAMTVAPLRGLTGAYTMDPRGWIKKVELDAPPDAPREAHDIVDELKWAFYQMAPSFPRERVGEGTKWTAHRGLVQGGVAVNQLSTMQISKLRGTRVDIKTDLQQTAQTQTFQAPGHPDPLELVSLAAGGRGELWWDLSELTPRTASVVSTVQRVYRYDKGGERIQMIHTTTRSLNIPAK